MQNKRNLISLAVVCAIFLAIIVAGVVGNVRSGNYIVLPIIFTAFGMCGVAVWLIHFRVRVLLRDRTPDRIIAHYHRSVRRIPHADAAAAYLSAMAATFFGQFDRARAELDAVKWDATTPVYQGYRLYVLAMLAMLEENDDPKALRLASEAGGGLPLLDDVIHLVAEGPNPERLQRLEKAARKQYGLIPAMCAWALALHYRRVNQPDLAGEYKTVLRLAIPHCAPLQTGTIVAGS